MKTNNFNKDQGTQQEFDNILHEAMKSSEYPDEALVQKLKKNEERIHMKNKRIVKPSIAIVAALIATLTLSVAVFGQDIANYIRTITLGEHVTFVTGEVEMSELEERQALMEETQELIDAGYLVVYDFNTEFNWLTFADAEEGKSHFITDAMLPTYAPEGFEFDHIFFFVESLEELGQFGANMFMSVVFSNGDQEISIQVRYMTEDTGFVTGATEDVQTININGHEAVVDHDMVNLLVGDVMYMFRGMGNADELIKMAESLQ